MTDLPELICAYRIEGDGTGTPLDWQTISQSKNNDKPIWIHLNCKDPNTPEWLKHSSGIDTYIVDALLAEETRPRCDEYPDGTLLVLRGVNLNPGENPEDMVSIRIWIEQNRIVSTRVRKLMAIEDLENQFKKGTGPVSVDHLIARLSARLVERIMPVIDNLDDSLASLEEKFVDPEPLDNASMQQSRKTLIHIRQVAITLRRYLAPQREAFSKLIGLDKDWKDEKVRGRLQENLDRITRITEELDEIRERSAIIQDEFANRISQRMEKTMYVLTVVATVMLPLGFLTGLLGINVGGIPGTEDPNAFWIVSAALMIIVAVEIAIFKILKWM